MLLTTISTRFPQVVADYLAHTVAPRVTGNELLLFSLSAPRSSSDLAEVVSHLTSFASDSQTSKLGCISNTVNTKAAFSCSLALLSKENIVPFRSTILGPKPTQVGRWHSFRERDDAEEDRYGPSSIFNTSPAPPVIPTELADLKPKDVQGFLYFSDLAPQGLTASLRSSFPAASQLGLLGASTPFITGRPVTLFQDERIWDSGAVGIALRSITSPASFKSHTLVPFSNSPPMTVTQSEGNMIVTLDSKNPTALLLAALDNVGADMTSLGQFTSDDALFAISTLSEPNQLYKITAGDPARGPISLESHAEAPRPGEQIMFHYRPSASNALNGIRETLPNGFTFEVSDEENQNTDIAGEETIIQGFRAASSNGFVIANDSHDAWRCTVPARPPPNATLRPTGFASTTWIYKK